MLSTHGYFDPVPQLGRTDTGGQVVYVLQLAKALSKCKVKVDIYTRWFDSSKKQIDPMPDCPGVRVIRVRAGPWEFIPKEEIYDILPELAENVIRFIQEKNIRYDLFHGHYVDGGIVSLDVAKAFGKPTFFTAHSLGAWKREQMGGEPKEMENKYGKATMGQHALLISQGLRKLRPFISKNRVQCITELHRFNKRNIFYRFITVFKRRVIIIHYIN